MNEPWEHAFFGYFVGEHAPGVKNPWTYFKVAHHELLGHGLAVERIRSVSPDTEVGITLSQFPIYPFTDTPKHRDAAHFADLFMNRFYLDGPLQRTISRGINQALTLFSGLKFYLVIWKPSQSIPISLALTITHDNMPVTFGIYLSSKPGWTEMPHQGFPILFLGLTLFPKVWVS